MLLIVEHLEFADLLSVAQMNVRLSRLAAYMVKRKYSNHEIIVWNRDMELVERDSIGDSISNALIQMNVKGKKESIKIEKSYIYIQDKFIVKTFKYLDVYNLRLGYFNSFRYVYGSNRAIQSMGAIISKYACDTLEKIEFKMSECVIKHITKPLVNVKSVSFSGSMYEYKTESIPINRIFPSMHRLNLNALMQGNDFLDHHMPQLMHLQTNRFDMDCDVTQLIRKNAQIISFETYLTNGDYLEKLNKFLPNLDTLILSSFNLGVQPLRFENVTKFTVKLSANPLDRLHFPKLNDLHLRLNEHEPLDVWSNFLQNHQHVTKFSLDGFNYVDYDIDRFIGQLPHLVELKLQLTEGEIRNADIISDFHSNSFIKSLEKHETLQVFFLISDCKRDRELIRKTFGRMHDQWHIKIIPMGLSFKRKSL